MSQDNNRHTQLDPHQLDCLLHLIDTPISSIEVANNVNTEHSLMDLHKGKFSGSISCTSEDSPDSGINVHFHVSVHSVAPANLTAVLSGFALYLLEDTDIITSEPFVADQEFQTVAATVNVTVRSLSETNGMRLSIADASLFH